ncbi:hypothetical protein BDP55DRAFT_385043 [Colletotrichum godetiae]|uniref:Uncharacterized protein n=1 Tax=Colletotrichum godetiae TaxID=1209918 RepID=A0AAJ0EXJ7_9PEZI|nr:uncharacterized protein BDP55DRAFT_385043 [Colletotrichum godetiae]KAK1689965.1 hypothetical protein BDP55DRAFT_385043 [Colletotrichum godetiae]
MTGPVGTGTWEGEFTIEEEKRATHCPSQMSGRKAPSQSSQRSQPKPMAMAMAIAFNKAYGLTHHRQMCQNRHRPPKPHVRAAGQKNNLTTQERHVLGRPVRTRFTRRPAVLLLAFCCCIALCNPVKVTSHYQTPREFGTGSRRSMYRRNDMTRYEKPVTVSDGTSILWTRKWIALNIVHHGAGKESRSNLNKSRVPLLFFLIFFLPLIRVAAQNARLSGAGLASRRLPSHCPSKAPEKEPTSSYLAPSRNMYLFKYTRRLHLCSKVNVPPLQITA